MKAHGFMEDATFTEKPQLDVPSYAALRPGYTRLIWKFSTANLTVNLSTIIKKYGFNLFISWAIVPQNKLIRPFAWW